MVSTVPYNDRGGSKKRARSSFDEITPGISNLNPVQIDIAQIWNQINIYRQLFTENKINRNNVWDIKIIDDLNYLVTNGVIDSETMLIAAMALDICLKVYACKVEYIQNEITKLMSNTQPQAQQGIATVPAKAKNVPHKNKAKKRKRRTKMYLAKDPRSILLPKIPKVPPIHFIENWDLYASNFENMSTISTPINNSRCKFELLNHVDCGFISYDAPDPTTQTKLLPPINVSVKPIVICPEFHAFNVDEDDEDYKRSLVDPLNDHYSQDTVPNLEEYMPSSFPDVAVDDARENDEINYSTGKRIETITSLSPACAFVENLTSSNPFLDIIWMGPNHWKNKLVRPSASQCSRKDEEKIINPYKKRRILRKEIEPINFHDSNIPKINFRQKCKPKRKKIDIDRCTRPPKAVDDLNFDKMINAFNLRKDCGEYSYGDDLLNSSQECTNDDTLEENQAPDVVPEDNYIEYKRSSTSVSTRHINMTDKNDIPYARRARRVNMRKLKTMLLSCLIEDDNAKFICNDSIEPTKFTDVHRKLLQKLPVQMKNEISVHVVFLALLHVASEHNLIISGCPALNDAIIEKH